MEGKGIESLTCNMSKRQERQAMQTIHIVHVQQVFVKPIFQFRSVVRGE